MMVATSIRGAINDITRELTERADTTARDLLNVSQNKILELHQINQITRKRDFMLKQLTQQDSAARNVNLCLLEALRAKASYPDDTLVKDLIQRGIQSARFR